MGAPTITPPPKDDRGEPIFPKHQNASIRWLQSALVIGVVVIAWTVVM